MEVHFAPGLQAKLDQLATETGRPLEDVAAGYFDEPAQTRGMLNSRYDDLQSGRVKPYDGEEFWEYIAEDNPLAPGPHHGPLRFTRVREYLIACSPHEKRLWVVASKRGRRSPRVMAAVLRGRE
jgi:hypothetical protein